MSLVILKNDNERTVNINSNYDHLLMEELKNLSNDAFVLMTDEVERNYTHVAKNAVKVSNYFSTIADFKQKVEDLARIAPTAYVIQDYPTVFSKADALEAAITLKFLLDTGHKVILNDVSNSPIGRNEDFAERARELTDYLVAFVKDQDGHVVTKTIS